MIEDVLGNDVYFCSLKRVRPNDSNTERMQAIDLQNIEKMRILFRYSTQEIILNKIKVLENQVKSLVIVRISFFSFSFQQENIFEYLEYLMNAMEKIDGDDIQMPKQSRLDL